MDSVYLDIQSPDMTQRVPLSDTPVTVGRHTDNTVVLTDVQASRFHCVIARAGDGIVVRDLDSRNGTRVNGEKRTTARLSPGDTVSVGATSIRLEIVAEEASRPTRAKVTSSRRAPRKNVVIPPPPPRPGAAAVSDETPTPRRPTRIPRRPGAKPLAPPPPPPPPPPPAADDDDEGEIKLVMADDDVLANLDAANAEPTVDFGINSTATDDERFLPVLAESLPEKTFGADDFSLVNQRGQVIHPAAGKKNHDRHVINSANAGDAVGVLRQILVICCRARATDVHVEPRNDDFQLRLRIDGIMVDVVHLSKPTGIRLCSLVKVLCEIDLQYRNTIQEGHFAAIVPNRRIDYRVSFAPAMQGQKLVIRVLDTANSPVCLADLKMPGWMTDEVKRVSDSDSGMILVVGPTGSGKTSTLYATLRDVGTGRRNVVTIEDPVEMELPGVTQVPINETQGNTFPNLLRSMLRQDPDVIMVGEIRDVETAGIAMQAAMTGHLVLSTLHTRDTMGTVFRLLDLGVERYLVASALQVVIAQRLVRLLCPYCKKAVAPTAEQLQRMGKRGRALEKSYVPVGCRSCLNTGYAGRRAIFEMLTATDELREVIMKNPSPKEIQRALAGSKFISLIETGYQLVAQGVTALDEIEKAVGRG